MSDDNNMPPFCKEFNSFQKDEAYQRKLYFLNEKLQIMFRELPLKYQQRIPNELLCSLAESLADNTVFGIVNSLMDIQHVTEKQLFQQRLQFTANQSSAMQTLMNKKMDDSEKEVQRASLEKKHREELKEYDKKVILELDRKIWNYISKYEPAVLFYSSKPSDLEHRPNAEIPIVDTQALPLLSGPVIQYGRNIVLCCYCYPYNLPVSKRIVIVPF